MRMRYDIEWKLLGIIFDLCQWVINWLLKIEDFINNRHSEILEMEQKMLEGDQG